MTAAVELTRSNKKWIILTVTLASCERQDCTVEACQNGCGMSLHRCKVAEHTESTCPESRVPCINTQHGCEAFLRRKHIVSHLEHCPASTVMCKFSHDRMTTYSSRAKANPTGEVVELLLDGSFLKGDLEIAQSEFAVYCSGEFFYGDLDYGVSMPVETSRERIPSDPNCPLSDSDVSINCTVGVLTHTTVATASEYNAMSLRPRETMCLKIPVQFRHHTTKRCSGTKPRSRLCYTFPCNEIVRRDEFPIHWKCLHLDVEIDMCRIVERCPMHSYGCTHGETRLVPGPPGSSIEYRQAYKHFLLQSPDWQSTDLAQTDLDEYTVERKEQDLELELSTPDEESNGSIIELERLPAEVLVVICEFLDSMTLWNLSQTSCYIREVCLSVVRIKGIVYRRWARDETSKRWTLGPKVSIR